MNTPVNVRQSQDFNLMILSGTYDGVHIDFGKDEPGMILQYRNVERGYYCVARLQGGR